MTRRAQTRVRAVLFASAELDPPVNSTCRGVNIQINYQTTCGVSMARPRKGSRPVEQSSEVDTSVEFIWKKFSKLIKLRDEAHLMFADVETASPWTLSRADIETRVIEPIESALNKLGWMAANTIAANQKDIELKTKILTHCMPDQRADLVTALAESLARDLGEKD